MHASAFSHPTNDSQVLPPACLKVRRHTAHYSSADIDATHLGRAFKHACDFIRSIETGSGDQDGCAP